MKEYLPTVSKLINDVWSVGKICENGTRKLVIGCDMSSYIQFNDCYQDFICTKSITGNNFIKQDSYRCLDCFPDDETLVMCKPCAALCHSHHNIVKTDTQRLMFCDCDDSSVSCEAK